MQNNQSVESQGNQQIKQKPIMRKIIIAYASSIFISLMLAPLVGRLYSKMFKVYCGGGILSFGIDTNCSFEGFILGYSFLLALALVLSRTKVKTIIITWLIGILLFLLLFIGEWTYFFALFILGILGYLLGKLILRLKKQ